MFTFRALKPGFDAGEALVQGRLDGSCARMWLLHQNGHMAMTAAPSIG